MIWETQMPTRFLCVSLSLSAEIQSCLVSSGDVGCGTFQCFNNNSCEIQGLHHICLTLLHNAGCYDSQVGYIETIRWSNSRVAATVTFSSYFPPTKPVPIALVNKVDL